MPVILAGAGCGSPQFLTESTRRALESAGYLVYDRLIHPDLLQLAPPNCRFHPVGKRGGRESMRQREINDLLVTLGRTGETVVRLKGGDPFVFGRGGEEAVALQAAGVPWSALPGITAALGGSLALGLPVTHRGLARSLTLATGRFSQDEAPQREFWQELAAASGTLALYMSAEAFPAIARSLMAAGKDAETPVAVINWGGWGRAERRNGTLRELAADRIASPATVLIGPVAGLDLTPSRGPLKGLQVAICRPFPESWQSARSLELLGADCYSLPLLRQVTLADAERDAVCGADWLVLTSPRAAEPLKQLVRDLRAIKGQIVALGDATARTLAEIGLSAAAVAGGTSDSLAEVISRLITPGDSVVFARNELGSDVAVLAAKERGAAVRSVNLYRMEPSLPPGLEIALEQWEECGLDAAVFGSAALVREWHACKLPTPRHAVAWGKTCAEEAYKLLSCPTLVMRQPNQNALEEVLRSIWKQTKS